VPSVFCAKGWDSRNLDAMTFLHATEQARQTQRKDCLVVRYGACLTRPTGRSTGGGRGTTIVDSYGAVRC
jgi:hypothetical protein